MGINYAATKSGLSSPATSRAGAIARAGATTPTPSAPLASTGPAKTWDTTYGQVSYGAGENGNFSKAPTWDELYGPGGKFGPEASATYKDAHSDTTQLMAWARQYEALVRSGQIKIPGGPMEKSGVIDSFYKIGHDPVLAQDRLGPRPGEDEAAWATRVGNEWWAKDFSGWVKNQPDYDRYKNMLFTPNNPTTGKTAEQTAQEGAFAADVKAKDERGALRDRIQQFSAELTKPLDVNDPEMQTIVSMASNEAARRARLAGINGGGLAINNTERAVADAAHGYNMQRKQLGLGALGLENQADLGAAELAFREKEANRASLRDRYQSDLGVRALQAERDAAPWRTALSIGSTLLSFAGGVVPGLIAGGANMAAGLGGGGSRMRTPQSLGMSGGSAVSGTPGGFSTSPNRIGGGGNYRGGLGGI